MAAEAGDMVASVVTTRPVPRPVEAHGAVIPQVGIEGCAMWVSDGRRGLRRVNTSKGHTVEIIGVIIAGIIIGLLGKFVAPGDKDNIPIWLTILCGIGGVLIGYFIYRAFGGNGS